jgi:hypothetical protein
MRCAYCALRLCPTFAIVRQTAWAMLAAGPAEGRPRWAEAGSCQRRNASAASEPAEECPTLPPNESPVSAAVGAWLIGDP